MRGHLVLLLQPPQSLAPAAGFEQRAGLPSIRTARRRGSHSSTVKRASASTGPSSHLIGTGELPCREPFTIPWPLHTRDFAAALIPTGSFFDAFGGT